MRTKISLFAMRNWPPPGMSQETALLVFRHTWYRLPPKKKTFLAAVNLDTVS